MLITSLFFLATAAAAPLSNNPTTREVAVAILDIAKRENKDPRSIISDLLGSDGSYAPYQMPCPSGVTWVRAANALSSGEQSFLTSRKAITQSKIQTQLASHNLPNPSRTPTIAYSLSGGGYRAMINGLGVVMATMNQSTEAAASGIGGWFDGMTYMAGLSGGSWATGSFMANGGPLPTDLVNNVWNLPSNLVFPSDDKVTFYSNLISEVSAKSDEGFPTQITDYWALALADHLLPVEYRTGNSPNLTFSNLTTVVPALGNASLPMPIIVAAEREPNELVIAENATLWEFTPYEFGSWAFGSTTKVRGAFTPLEYLGSQVNNGQANGTCWKGFDQLDFVMGTSSTLFNGAFLQLNGTNSDGLITDAIEAILGAIGEDKNDVALYPNSFANWNDQPNPISNFTYITLVDAGETNQNIPIEPLLVPYREVDAILAIDNSADTTYSWPNGSALYTTYTRAKILAENQDVKVRMPEVPSPNGFINGGYNTRPTFFGCNDTTTPVIIYVPNYPWSAYSNTSTYMLSYDNQTATNNMLSSMRALTLNGTVPTWPTCLACALTDRTFSYTTSNRTSTCQQCFDTWCWSGVDNTATPSGEYEPVVGTIPKFLTDKGLTSTGGQSSAAPGSTQTQTSTSAAATSSTSGAHGLGVSLAAVVLGTLTALATIY